MGVARALVLIAALAGCALGGAPGRARAQGAEASPSPNASPSPRATPSDPCGGPGRLLATANRPTIGYSTCAVAAHTVVFELGYQNQVNATASAGSVQSQVPQNFLRVGVAPHFELDVIGPNYVATRVYATAIPGRTSYGVNDSGLGFKFQFPTYGRLSLAIDGLDTPPNGSPFLTAGNATLTGNLDASYSLSPATSIGTTIAVASTGGFTPANTHARYGVTTPSFVLTTQIPNFYQFYAEYVYVSKIAPNLNGRAFIDAGVQKLLGTRTEIDVEYGHSLIGDPGLSFSYVGAGLVIQLR
jgi:hypothetical protein